MNEFEARYLLVYSISAALLSLVGWLVRSRFPRSVVNFRGDTVPSGYGVYLAAFALATGIAARDSFHWPPGYANGYLIAVAAMAVFGLLDDLFSTHGQGGFRGHLRALLVNRKVTTGALKLFGGGIASLAAAYLMHRPSEHLATIVIDGGIIAASANLINLLDLRPGRASWSFLFLSLLLCLYSAYYPFLVWVFAPLASAVIWWLPTDMKGRQIMGDSGSNVIGAVLGLGVVMFHPLPFRIGVFVALLAMHIYAEKRSISKAIASSPILGAIDRRLGVR